MSEVASHERSRVGDVYLVENSECTLLIYEELPNARVSYVCISAPETSSWSLGETGGCSEYTLPTISKYLGNGLNQ